MTRKRKRYPSLQQKLERPWCYYCERDFDDLKILISHQKAKHFKCDRCGRRLNTAGGLSVHMNQVHKEPLTQVENAISGRQGLDVEIFGMEGVPQDVIEQHIRDVEIQHFEEEQERARISGNPIRSQYPSASGQSGAKRARVKESLEEIVARAEKFRDDKAKGILPVRAPAPAVEVTPQVPPPAVPVVGAPVTQTPPFAPGAQAFPLPGAPPPIASFPPGQQFPPAPPGFAQPPGFPGAPPFAAGPPGVAAPPGFPPVAPPPGFAPPSAISASVDELISSATADTAPEKKEKPKKEKNIKLVYFDESISPEEKMARLPRFAATVRT
ncbi:hypothetical protein M011DRAFT_209570 [Sporormia fimetaria CBS 119925]|uniref:C2H2-type domain-containing protein n=1 Tax=Sporormia fimetaria CBS 119925 TaxID=1340428 RepID=A0A6A6V3G9_9PLEO|nr:hypothetical protein M011DRAFT_209570 [Sporormia fimetaria CBS 119925]